MKSFSFYSKNQWFFEKQKLIDQVKLNINLNEKLHLCLCVKNIENTKFKLLNLKNDNNHNFKQIFILYLIMRIFQVNKCIKNTYAIV